jgi:hypothetical protein
MDDQPHALERKLLPEYGALQRYHYAIFGSLDFRSPYARQPANERLRTGLFRQFIVAVSRRTGIHRRHLQHFVTDEWSSNQEKHLHFIIPDTVKVRANLILIVTTMKDVWENEIRAGRCKVEAFDEKQKDKCLRYICKRQQAWDGNEAVELEKEAHVSKEFRHWMERDSSRCVSGN